MKKSSLVFVVMVALFAGLAYAEDAAAPATTAPATETPAAAPAPAAPAPSPVVAQAPAVPAPAAAEVVKAPEPAAVPASVPAVVPAADAQTAITDNLEFISGEVSAMDEAAKTVSVRLYGENEDKASDKVLTVNVDQNTDITDGEQDRALKSLTAGTEVDVEYDPATNKATYIFVY